MLHSHLLLLLGLLVMLGVSFGLDPRDLLELLDGHGHEDGQHMHGSGLELFCSLVDLEAILLNSICDLILLVVLLLLAVVGVLLFKHLHDAPLLEIAEGKDCGDAAFEETTRAYCEHVVEGFRRVLDYR